MTKRGKEILRVSIGAALFVAAVIIVALAAPALGSLQATLPYPFLSLAIFLVPYLVLGWPVLKKAARNIAAGHIFDENFLMCVATIGALCLAEFPEAVAVMLFYQIGDLFEDYAVDKSRDSIAEMMDICPEQAYIERNGEIEAVDPDEVEIGTIIVVRPGERVPLDGIIVKGETELDTAALTGESLPRNVFTGDPIASGSINLSSTIYIETTKEFEDSTVSRILELVEDAASEKAPMENFITRFARYYTPIVCLLALLIAIIPPFFTGFDWADWVQRALIFLVVSCPCALVISIPLSFFGGIGGASACGILVKGSTYLEELADTRVVVFDKTGTLTQGTFKVVKVCPVEGGTEDGLVEAAALAESWSKHPISLSIKAAYGKDIDSARVTDVEELGGHGVTAKVDGKTVAAGNARLMESEHIDYTAAEGAGTIVYVARDGQFLGSILISDEEKPTAGTAMQGLQAQGVRTVMLTGDAPAVAELVAKDLGIDEVHAGLLPADKVAWVEKLLAQKPEKKELAFVGDGINDAPVLMRADIGIAMGALGSDAAIEAADIVLMDDDPAKISLAMRISRKCMRIVYQNIVFALAVKALCLILTALGITNMWWGVFADVGVMILAVLNATRMLNVKEYQ